MNLCTKCQENEDNIQIRFICLGDGHCKKHGSFAFSKSTLKEYCTECAIEKGICQICGVSK